MTNPHIDFDARWAKRKPVTVTVFGETYDLPPSLPLKVLLRVEEIRADAQAGRRGEDFTANEVFELARSLFGEQTFDEWIEDGLEQAHLEDLLAEVFARYMDGSMPASKTPAARRSTRKSAARKGTA